MCAAELININTATVNELKALDGVGDVVAESIIDNRPYDSIEEVSRASGIGAPGSVSYEKIKNYITVGSVGTPPPQTQTATATSTQTSAAGSVGPPALEVRITGGARTIAGAGSVYEAQAYNVVGEPITQNVRYIWSFGDGASAEGKRVFHTYRYAGPYVLSVSAAYNYSGGMARMRVDAVSGTLSLTAQNDGSLLVWNHSSEDVDIGLWFFTEGSLSFTVPEHTLLLAGEGVRFATTVTGIVATQNAKLFYPNGQEALAVSPAADSPLRGQRVIGTPAKSSEAPSPPISPSSRDSVGGGGLTASVAQSSGGGTTGALPLWASVAGLGVLIALGLTGVYYARVTKPQEGEFEIE